MKHIASISRQKQTERRIVWVAGGVVVPVGACPSVQHSPAVPDPPGMAETDERHHVVKSNPTQSSN